MESTQTRRLFDLADVTEAVHQFRDSVMELFACLNAGEYHPGNLIEVLAKAGEAEYILERHSEQMTVTTMREEDRAFLWYAQEVYNDSDAGLEALEFSIACNDDLGGFQSLDRHLQTMLQSFQEKAALLGQEGFGMSPPPFDSDQMSDFHDVLALRDALGWLHFALARRQIDGRLEGVDANAMLQSLAVGDIYFERLLARLSIHNVKVPERPAPSEFYWCTGQYATELASGTDEESANLSALAGM